MNSRQLVNSGSRICSVYCGARDRLVGWRLCHQAWWPECSLQNPHSGRRKRTQTSCSLIFTQMHHDTCASTVLTDTHHRHLKKASIVKCLSWQIYFHIDSWSSPQPIHRTHETQTAHTPSRLLCIFLFFFLSCCYFCFISCVDWRSNPGLHTGCGKPPPLN